jgi:hypothetical protein
VTVYASADLPMVSDQKAPFSHFGRTIARASPFLLLAKIER